MLLSIQNNHDRHPHPHNRLYSDTLTECFGKSGIERKVVY
jgi:hypothetical protein